MTTLSSLHEWSDKLKAEGKEVPKDVVNYEALIEKDLKFVEGYSKQLNNNKALMERLGKDISAYNHIKQLRMNAINISNKGQFNNSIWGEGYQGYGNGITSTATKLVLPERDWTDDQINKKVMKNIDKPRDLIPIRLGFDLERDRFKLRDTFLWDLNEEVLTVESFAKQLVDDYKLIAPGFYDTVAASIREQINDYQKNPTKPLGELRIPIKIDVTINNIQLTDQFEWDILNFEENDPEDFAVIMCDEMSLPGEFTTAIAHTIREQTQFFHKTLYMVGYNFDGSSVQEEEIRTHLLPALRLVSANYTLMDDFFSILRNPTTVADYSPSLVKLSQLEVERLDKEIERESRRKRRHNATELELPSTSGRGTTSRRTAFHVGRGGPSLPDLSDLPKTFRTPAPSSILPGAVDLGVPDIYEYTEIYANKTQVRNPDYKPPPQPIKDQVRYHHDPILGSLYVRIKLPQRR
ncbi:SNF5-domain-containing protein [Suhomyces tanzawaensis NRRL Y-17324]|uniref:SNF5-domain-containing protein n=1 Tax=Suhomyces tanzawaensis NRRL Y-17324 TaxID=984487 RepID=A0A1E4SJ27_9ASCO|nr:SNF5-domain-containing protein [Suhomyces tanzawaensis NRRL Y-17324]ODV79515.1 SNF5-domain-containing protein [Suhomyces tanzawaensis NRRL Y-17324]